MISITTGLSDRGKTAFAFAAALWLTVAAMDTAIAQVGGLPAGGGERLDGVAAVVEGEPIFESEIEEQLYLFLMQTGMRPDSSEAKKMRREILDRLVDEKLIVQEAERMGVTVPDAEIEAQVDAAIDEAKQRLGGEAGFQTELAREGTSEAQLRERYRAEIQRQALANQLLRRQLNLDLEVSPVEAEAYFAKHRDEFPMKPADFRLALIQIPIEPEEAELAKARTRAEAALARVKKGESFTRVAQEVSEDPTTKNSGGDLGFFGKGQLEPVFEQTAFSLSPGEISGIILTPFGFHIIRVEEVDTAKGEVHARHMLFRIPLTPEDQERAEKKADIVYQKAIGGGDFSALIAEYSSYGGDQGGGGDLGFMPASEFSPEIKAVLDTLKTGNISSPLVSPQGYVIFRMLDKRPERQYEMEEIKDDLPEFVRRLRLQNQYEDWVAALRKKAHVEIKMQ
jgi:peptidyl-prolyl cis-trans isomerase SurA